VSRTSGALRLELLSDPEMPGVVRSGVMRLTEVMDFSEADCRGVTRVVDEALTNIVWHAYGGRPWQPIEMTCRRMQERTGKRQAGLEIVLVDRVRRSRKSKCRSRDEPLQPRGLFFSRLVEARIKAPSNS
jgi:anti-sigma regulatory factor (Ser/Thr protein kinase)